MKNLVLLVLLTLFFCQEAKSCDACGCGISSTYWGLIPNNSAAYVGLWYQRQYFRTDLSYLQEDGRAFFSSEDFNTFEWRARYSLNQKTFLRVVVPFVYHRRAYGDDITEISGIGDIRVHASYIVLNTTDSLLSTVRHRLAIGGGIKAPTGKYQLVDALDVVNPNFQAGTGSWDFLLEMAYTARWLNWGVQVNGSYKINTTNSDAYRFGNQLNGGLNLFYLHPQGAIDLMPSVGLAYDHADLDVERGFYQRTSGGTILSAQAGFEIYWDQLNLGFNYLHPLEQKWADGVIEVNPRWSVHLSFSF